jgi:hypothetical protein
MPEIFSEPMRRPAIVMAAGALAALAVAALALTGCAGAANHSTAKLVKRGDVQIAPHYNDYRILATPWLLGRRLPDSSGRVLDLGDALGGSIALGLSDRINVRARYERASLYREVSGQEAGTSPDREEDFGALDLKVSTEPLREAVSFTYGLYPGSRLHMAVLTSYHNLYFNRSWYYCLAPGISILMEDRESREWGFNLVLNNSLTFEFRDAVYVRPEVGVSALSLFAGLLIVNAGVSAGVAF